MRSAKRSAFTSLIVIVLLTLAIALGYFTDMLWMRWERSCFPTLFSDDVISCAEQYDLDADMIYAVIKVTSNFASNHISEDGRIGLMQLSEETFRWLSDEHLRENLDSGLLYEPSTNIRYGCYYLLYLTTCYESWDAVLAAYLVDQYTVDPWYWEWQADSEAEFIIPDSEIQKKVTKIQQTVDKYKKLYDKKEMYDHESDESR